MAVVMVTGSNSGFGLAIAAGFLARGDDVVAGIRRVEAGVELRARSEGLGGRLEVVPLDVTDAASRNRA